MEFIEKIIEEMSVFSGAEFKELTIGIKYDVTKAKVLTNEFITKLQSKLPNGCALYTHYDRDKQLFFVEVKRVEW